MVAEDILSPLLFISALGIYIHAVFLSISLGFPWVIGSLLYKWWRSKDSDYYSAARTATGVLGLNFALGAITGTLVEFGLVQAWPGSIFLIATFGLMPLTLELVAFIGEVVLLILFVVTLGRAKPLVSLVVLGVYAIMAMFSGAVITTVNSWMNVPWGTDGLAGNIYPFLPQYGPKVIDFQSLLKLKVEFIQSLLAGGAPSQALQDPKLAQNIGLVLQDPLIALMSPYNLASVLHAVTAATIVGICFALAAYAYRFFKTGQGRYLKIIRAFLPVLLVLLILQPVVFGDMMGKAVASDQPTKFALMENANTTINNPLIAFLAYGDPNHPIAGFNSFRNACAQLGGKTLGDLVAEVVPGYDAGAASSIPLSQLCLSDVARSEAQMSLINTAYYSKVTLGALALVSLIALASITFKLGPLSRLTELVLSRLGRKRSILFLSLMVSGASILTASLGWFVREIGRKPWTVYGLLYPQEVVTPVPVNPAVLALFTLAFVGMAALGLYGMYVFATKPLKFMELLKKRAGVE
jgi:cytochrome d ubiquinol oxidase subunit I